MHIINLIISPFFNIYNSSGVLECIITNNFVLLGRYTEWGERGMGGVDRQLLMVVRLLDRTVVKGNIH